MSEDEMPDDEKPDAEHAGETEGPEPDERVLAEWRIHMFKRNVRRSLGAVAACLAALVLIHFAFWSPWLTVLGGLILFGSLSDLFLPITYRLTTRGAFYTNFIFRKRMTWDDVRATYVSDFGVKLSPFSRPTRLEAFRGIVLYFSGPGEGAPGSREQVIRIVKERATKRR